MTVFFQFEADFVDSLRCIPMQVRMNLDTCGVKLKLEHWNKFSSEEKEALVSLPCNTPGEVQTYREFLQNLVTATTGTPAQDLPTESLPAWLNTEEIPPAIQSKAAEFQIILTPNQWLNLTPLQRFALIKLSRPSHENHNFYPALQEFGLL
jgi:hypothetical protein